jgi:hypothetical protein
MIETDRTIAFIQTKGDIIEQARLGSIVWGKLPTNSVLKKLAEMQNPDGGFACWIKDFSSVCDTVYVLAWLDDLSLRSGPLVDGAFAFLLNHQMEDGGWDELERVRESNPPEFLLPGKAETRVWLTAYCAHWFVRFGRAEPPGAKGCPVDFLLAHREPSGRLQGYLRATWDALVLFSYHPGQDSEVFQDTLKAIEKAFRPKKWEGSYLAWLLGCLRDAGLSPNYPLVRLCLDELIKKQRSDGSWESEDGEKYAVNATIEALRVLKHYGVV